ncbi:MAG: hypothetical protein ACHREM_09495 [Polyangiales bacterium]
MNMKTLIERTVRDGQSDFAAILERKLAVLLVGEDETRVAPRRTAESVKLTVQSQRQRATAPTAKATAKKPSMKSTRATADVEPAVAAENNQVFTKHALLAEIAASTPGDFEVDLPILRAIANDDAILVVGGYPTVETLAEIPRLTGLQVERMLVAPEAADATLASLIDRVRRDALLGLVFVGDGGFSAADLALVIVEARKTGLAVARSADGSLTSLLSALEGLERAASGSPTSG